MSFPSFGGAKECGQDEHFANLVEKGRESGFPIGI